MEIESASEWGQLVTLLLMATAVGLDSFSLGVGIGLKGVRLLHIFRIGVLIGVFHVIMPLMGMFTGQYVSTLLGGVATVIGGTLLVLLGSHMIYSSLRGDSVQSIDYSSLWGLLLFAFLVSIDSFSVGVSLGLFSTDILLTVLLFGISGASMSVLGLMIGRRVGGWAGGYGEAFGGVILLTFGISFLL